jgi:Ni,Fe-hydrogenase I large subunit
VPTLERVLAYKTRLKKLMAFVDDTYLPDLVTAAGAFPHLWDEGKGYGDMLSYGVFELAGEGETLFPSGTVIGGSYQPLDPGHITEEIGHSRFDSPTGLHPSRGETRAAPHKDGAYSWLKAPRYQGRAMEVGPLARVLTGYHAPGGGWIREEVDAVLKQVGLPAAKLYSVLGRHLARGLEAVWVARAAWGWLDELDIGGAPARDFDIPNTGGGMGLTEAPRGALGHWITVANHRIGNYQCVVPTTWNCSPRDDAGRPGPVEKALEGIVINDPDHPIEPARLVRAYDPCIACAVH